MLLSITSVFGECIYIYFRSFLNQNSKQVNLQVSPKDHFQNEVASRLLSMKPSTIQHRRFFRSWMMIFLIFFFFLFTKVTQFPRKSSKVSLRQGNFHCEAKEKRQTLHAGTQNSINMLRLYVAEVFVKRWGKQQSRDVFTGYHRENKTYKK